MSEHHPCQRTPYVALLLSLGLLCGVAGQNALLGLVCLLWPYSYRERVSNEEPAWTWLKASWVFGLLAILWVCFRGVVTERLTTFAALSHFIGHGAWLILPCLSLVLRMPDAEKLRDSMERSLGSSFWFLGLICLSQAFLGWRMIDGVPALVERYRALGFTSHPLTLAYMAIPFMPWTLHLAVKRRTLWAYAGLFGMGSIVYATQSRAVQGVVALYLAWAVIKYLRGWQRWLSLGLGAILLAALLLIDNPIRERFEILWIGSEHIASAYPDDRWVFWQVSWLMVLEQPWGGIGPLVQPSERLPYFALAGFAEFPRMYNAHNTFLEMLVQGGMVGLGLLVAWGVSLWRACAANHRLLRSNDKYESSEEQGVLWAGVACLLLASVTQNSLQDSEVRYGLGVLSLYIALWSRVAQKSHQVGT